MNARMRLLFFTNGLLLKAGRWTLDRGLTAERFAVKRISALEQMRKDGRT